MIYRVLGRTGLKVSQLGFGAMRLPMVGEGEAATVDREKSTAMIHKAFESGINYIDTAIFYCNNDSQRAVGDALKGWRDKIILSTKNHYFGEDESAWWKNLEDSLERLQVDYLDIYHAHGINSEIYNQHFKPRVSKWFQKAKDQGLIKHICFSFHDKNDKLIEILDSDFFDIVTLQYNMLDRQLEEGIAHAHEKGIGVVVMGPVAGGRLGGDVEVLKDLVPGIERVPELALRFVLANPNISLALSGMSTMEQLVENVSICSDASKLSDADQKAIDEHLDRLKAMEDLYCSGCGYCMPCPNEINIPYSFALYNQARVYGLWQSARDAYAYIGGEFAPWKKADACSECGVCEEKCPQNLPIRKQLAEVHTALTQPAENS